METAITTAIIVALALALAIAMLLLARYAYNPPAPNWTRPAERPPAPRRWRREA